MTDIVKVINADDNIIISNNPDLITVTDEPNNIVVHNDAKIGISVIEDKDIIKIDPALETININTEKEIIIVSNIGLQGQRGYQYGIIHLYKRSTTKPTKSDDSLYNFETNTLSGVTGGWLEEPSDSDTGNVYSIKGTLNEALATNKIQTITWSEPFLSGGLGPQGVGVSTIVITNSTLANGNIRVSVVTTLTDNTILPTQTFIVPKGDTGNTGADGTKGDTPTFDSVSVNSSTGFPTFTFDGTAHTADTSIIGPTPSTYLKSAVLSNSNNTITFKDQDDNSIVFNDTKQDIVALTARVTTNEDDISTNEDNITDEIADRKTADTALDTKITTEKDRITENETDISTNTTKVSALDTKVTNLDSTVTTLSGNVSANTTNITSYGTRILKNETDIGTLETADTKHTQDISTNAANINQNVTDIDANSAKIANNTTTGSSNSTSISQINTKLNKAFDNGSFNNTTRVLTLSKVGGTNTNINIPSAGAVEESFTWVDIAIGGTQGTETTTGAIDLDGNDAGSLELSFNGSTYYRVDSNNGDNSIIRLSNDTTGTYTILTTKYF